MTTAEDLRAEREQAERQRRRDEREAARRTVARHAHRHGLSMAAEDDVLGMLGLLGDPEDDGVPVVLPHAFSQPAARLSAPASGTYRLERMTT